MASIPGVHGAAQYAKFTKEATWGTFDGTATVHPWIDIEPNGFMLDRKPIVQTGRVATGNIPGRRVASKYEVTASYKTKMLPELMVNFIPWACTPTVVGGKLTLPSFSMDWMDGVVKRRFRGMRVEEASFVFGSEPQWGFADFKLRGKDEDSVAPTMTEPAGTAYPQVQPHIIQDTAGFCELAGVVLTGYDSIKITYKNILDARFDEYQTVDALDYCGRDVTWEVTAKHLDSVKRAIYENQTPVASLLKWQVITAEPITYTTIFDLQDTVYCDDRSVNRDFGKSQYETLKFTSFRDLANGVDAVATSTAA